MKLTTISILFLLFAVSTSAQNVNNFTVQQAVDYAKQNSVQVKNALLDYQAQKQTNREITAAAYPKLNANGTFQDFLNIPVSLLPGVIVPGGIPGT
ncbi:MAG: TolC family protein, partial [Ferruginibacter sp.]|nr:TolC family protein [Ferruginibacter sp.]